MIYMNFKKIFFFVILIGIFWFSYAFDIETECEKRTFVVTAYYSPISGQAFYYKADYIQEKILVIEPPTNAVMRVAT